MDVRRQVSTSHDTRVFEAQRPGFRKRNGKAVLQALLHRTEPGQRVSPEWLAQASGVARGTVNNVLKQLRDVEARRAESGRAPVVHFTREASDEGKPDLVVLNPEAGFLAGLELGHRRITAAVADIYGRVRSPHDWDFEVDDRFDTDPDLALARGADLLSRVVGEARSRRVAGVGITVAAPVDPFTRLVLPLSSDIPRDRGPQPGDWIYRNPASELEERFTDWNCQFTISNDANVGAWAEYLVRSSSWGQEPALFNLAYVRWGTGVGGGLVIHDRRYPGPSGAAGEIGHQRVPGVKRSDVPTAPCRHCRRRDCLENVISYYRLFEAFGYPHDSMRGEVETNPHARPIIRRYARYLGQTLAGLVSTLNPQALAIAGPTPAVAGDVVEGVWEGLAEYGTPASVQALADEIYVPAVRTADIDDPEGRLSVVVGAIQRAFDVHAPGYLFRELL